MTRAWRVFRTSLAYTMRHHGWFGPVLSTVLLAAVINIITEWMVSDLGPKGSMIVVLTIAALALGFAVVTWRTDQKRAQAVTQWRPDDFYHPQPRKGLVFLFGRRDVLMKVVEYHHEALTHCWLIATPESEHEAKQARLTLVEMGLEASVRKVNSLYDTESCYDIVYHICTAEAASLGIGADKVIADVTGTTKPLTVGMTLAALASGCSVEHVPTSFGEDGRPNGPRDPIEIRMEPLDGKDMASEEDQA